MPIGTITNCLAVLFGGIIGAAAGHVIPQKLKDNLPVVFGLCSMGIGINSIIKASAMTAVVLTLLLGFSIGQLLGLEGKTERFFKKLVRVLHLGGDEIDMGLYVTIVALFCCSGFGWYSVMTEAISGDPSLLFSKAVLDFFTAVIFAATLGKAICAIPLPQIVILMCVYGVATVISPLITPSMFADLSACGGVLTMAAGLRVSKIKAIPLVDLIPSLLLILPISALWSAIM